ncbi:MAG: hypothetical protein ACI915_005083 [Gammaproteobacteria bacterium]|jgi:hypothetical protein
MSLRHCGIRAQQQRFDVQAYSRKLKNSDVRKTTTGFLSPTFVRDADREYPFEFRRYSGFRDAWTPELEMIRVG